MISKTISKQPKSQVEITIQVFWADLEPIYNQTLQRLSAELELPGFRKGMVPSQMAEQNLGSKLQDEVLKVIMPQFLIEALKGSDIVPIDYPKYQLTSYVPGQGLQYKALVTNRPEIKVGEYKTIKVSKPQPKQVTDEQVNKMIDDLFKRWKLRQPQGGQQPTGSSGQVSQGSISFQTSASANASADKPDDEFAKAMGAASLADLKDKIKKDLEGQANYENELDWEEAILQEVEKITTVDLPEVLIDDELNRMLVSLQRRVADMGMLMEDYLKGQGKSLDQLKLEWRPQAEKNVRMELGLSEIAKVENVQISDEDLQAEIDKIQDARIKKQFETQEPRLQLRHALRQTKTLDLLKKLVANG